MEEQREVGIAVTPEVLILQTAVAIQAPVHVVHPAAVQAAVAEIKSSTQIL